MIQRSLSCSYCHGQQSFSKGCDRVLSRLRNSHADSKVGASQRTLGENLSSFDDDHLFSERSQGEFLKAARSFSNLEAMALRYWD